MTPQDIAEKTGETIGTSQWVEMSQERINQFADATGDHQFIHIDEEKAKMTPFRRHDCARLFDAVDDPAFDGRKRCTASRRH